MKKNIVLFSLFVVLVSCSSNTESYDAQNSVSVDTQSEDYLRQDSYDVIRTVPLALPDNLAELPSSAKLLVKKDLIFVQDPFQKQFEVYVFDFTGAYQYKVVCRKGHARNEINGSVENFDVDGNNYIHIFNRDGGKVLVFDDKGKFSHSVLLEGMLPSSMRVAEDGNTYFFSLDCYSDKESRARLVQIDKQGKVLKTLYESDVDSNLGDNEIRPLSKNAKGEICYLPSLAEFALTLKNDSVIRTDFIFDRGFLSEEELEQCRTSGRTLLGSDKVSLITKCFQSDSLLFIEYVASNKWRSLLIDKAHHKTYNSRGLLCLQGLGSVSCFNNDNELVCLVCKGEIERKREDCEWRKKQNIKEELLPVMEQMLRGQIKTPAIVFVKMK